MSNLISGYGVWGVAGFTVGLLYLLAVSGKFHRNRENVAYLYVWASVACIIGAKILYICVIILSGSFEGYGSQPWGIMIIEYLRGGFVYYGGAFGALLGLLLACKYFSLNAPRYIDLIITALPLAHSISRVGCYRVGCCYGKETDSIIHVIYESSLFAPNGVTLVPVQLIEAAFEFTFWLILLAITIRKSGELPPFSLSKLYFGMYATMRFLIEFYRGDAARGFVGILSTSQIISLMVILFLAVNRVVRKRSMRLDF